VADIESTKKITSVLDLAKYQVGTLAYFVVMRPTGLIRIKPRAEDAWMKDYHPSIYHERGLVPGWDRRKRLPKLHAADFESIMSVLNAKLMVEEFVVAERYRSTNTGVFQYANQDKEWLPEDHLYDTIADAERECNRIRKLIQEWSA